MELEFDKEIDAILRKERSGIGAATATDGHLDADTIAAFAENALPEKTRLLFVEHFADCDRCRKQLSFVAQMNKDETTAAAAPKIEPVVEAAIPWYQSWFKAPNLALAMGALVLAFGGILGYMALQQKQLNQSAVVSKVTRSDQDRGDSNFNDEASSNKAPLEALIATANPTPPSANTMANTASVAQGAASGLVGRTDSDASRSGAAPQQNSQADGVSGSANDLIIDGNDVSRAKPSAKAAAEPAGRSQPENVEGNISSQSAELLPKG